MDRLGLPAKVFELERQYLELQPTLCIRNSITPIMSNAPPAKTKAQHQHEQ